MPLATHHVFRLTSYFKDSYEFIMAQSVRNRQEEDEEVGGEDADDRNIIENERYWNGT